MKLDFPDLNCLSLLDIIFPTCCPAFLPDPDILLIVALMLYMLVFYLQIVLYRTIGKSG